jgi:putative two-component system response regulator
MLIPYPARVLCVDDESNALDGLRRILNRSFEVVTAAGPEAGLEELEAKEPFAAIVSDLRMPGMSGIEFLARARDRYPDAVRLLLTGHADLASALEAVTRGAIFRFLIKPCAPETLHHAVSAAVEQYRSITVERALLEQAPYGGTQTLLDRVEAKVLIVDDEQASLDSLRRMLQRAGFERVCGTTDPREAVQLCLRERPDLILLDLHMPFVSGDRVLERLREEVRTDGYLPVLVLTGDLTSEAKHRAFAAGANDFVAKPYDHREVVLRIRNHLEIRRLQAQLQAERRGLEEAVRQRTAELQQSQIELLDRLARAAEYRDDDTGEHAKRVGALSARLASELGLSAEQVELIWRAAALHDLGKVGVADAILLKPGKLSDEEMATMRTHVSIGGDILAGGSSLYLQVAERIALTHHEWWDGGGYLGLAGEEIPIEGRVVAVADVFDALTHERPYKAAWTEEEAVDHITRFRGRHFDPAVVDALLRILAHHRLPSCHAPSF